MSENNVRIKGVAEQTITHRGAPPKVCSQGCPEYLSADICATCYRRPVLSTEYTRTPVTYRLNANGQPDDIRPVGQEA